MKSKLVSEALKDVLKPHSEEDKKEQLKKLFFDFDVLNKIVELYGEKIEDAVEAGFSAEEILKVSMESLVKSGIEDLIAMRIEDRIEEKNSSDEGDEGDEDDFDPIQDRWRFGGIL